MPAAAQFASTLAAPGAQRWTKAHQTANDAPPGRSRGSAHAGERHARAYNKLLRAYAATAHLRASTQRDGRQAEGGMSCLVAEPHAAALGRGRANPAASSSAAPSQRPHGTPTGRSRGSQTVEHRADVGEPHTHPGPCHAAEHLRQRATPQRRWGRGGEPHTSKRRTTRIWPMSAQM